MIRSLKQKNMAMPCLLAAGIVASTSALSQGKVTDVERLHKYRTSVSTHERGRLTNLGPTGCTGWFYHDRIHICSVDRGSPADGILQAGDYILSVNGKKFLPSTNPKPAFGRAITQAEATDGTLRLQIIRGVSSLEATIALEKLGTYAPRWPFDCKKSAIIREGALEYVLSQQKEDGTWGGAYMTSHAALFLLTSEEPEHLAAVRRAAHAISAKPGIKKLRPDQKGGNSWFEGYGALLLVEYYLRTGDSKVLSRLQQYGDDITAGQTRSGGWNHNWYGMDYSGGYGEVNQAGIPCFISLVLMKEAGLRVDERKLRRSAALFRRFAGAGCMHYGDGLPWQGNGENGLNGAGAIAFNLLEEAENVREFADAGARAYHLTEGCHTSAYWPHVWMPIGVSFADPELHKTFMQEIAWYYDLARRWDGRLTYNPHAENLAGATSLNGPDYWFTGGFGLAYSVATRKLRILGGEKTVFGRRVAESLKPAMALYRSQSWEAFDNAMIAWRKTTHSATAMKDAQDLLAARHLIKQMDSVREKQSPTAQSSQVAESDENPAPVGIWIDWLKNQTETENQWRTYAWETEEVSEPVMDNLNPAGEGFETWYAAGFDDSEWQAVSLPLTREQRGPSIKRTDPRRKKPSPYQAYTSAYDSAPYCHRLMRTTFEVEDPSEIMSARIKVLFTSKADVYLNGYRVAETYRCKKATYPCYMKPDALKLLRKGTNVLAVYMSGKYGCDPSSVSFEAFYRGDKSKLPPEPDVSISDLTWEKASCYWRNVIKDRDVRGTPLSINGIVFKKGLGMSAPGEVVYALKPEYKRFVAMVGVGDSGGRAAVAYIIEIDGVKVAESPIINETDWHRFGIPIPKGAKEISLITDPGRSTNNDYAGWVRVGFMKD